MRYAIVFSSKTGNTKLLADTLHDSLPQDACSYFGAPDPAALDADTLYVGFWTDKGTADAAIIDSLMAGAMVGKGTGYENLTHTVELTTEKYGVGFRKGSDLADKLNEFFKTSYNDGSMKKCAETYGVQDALIEQK